MSKSGRLSARFDSNRTRAGDEEEAHKTIERLSDDGWFEVKGRISPGAPQENVPRYRGPSEFEETCSVHPSVLKAVGGSPLIGDHIMARYSPGDRMIEVQSFNNSHFWLHIELPMGTGV